MSDFWTSSGLEAAAIPLTPRLATQPCGGASQVCAAALALAQQSLSSGTWGLWQRLRTVECSEEDELSSHAVIVKAVIGLSPLEPAGEVKSPDNKRLEQ